MLIQIFKTKTNAKIIHTQRDFVSIAAINRHIVLKADNNIIFRFFPTVSFFSFPRKS